MGVSGMAEARPLVMVVNDDAAMRDALQFRLRLEGLEVQAHADGAALLASRDLARAGCVILKDQMPGVGAFETLLRLHALDLAPPVILLTGAASAALRHRAAAAGVWLVLEKPILDNGLVDAVGHALAGQGASRPT
nr:response regulator [Acidocella sp. KAb 2-4]